MSRDSFLTRFQSVARAQDESTAVLSHGANPVSYRELYRRSRLLGNALSGQGAGPESVVALCLDKSADYIVSLLAAWWAQAAFMPVDPALPAERVVLMVQESGAKLAVVQRGYEHLFQGMNVQIINPLLSDGNQVLEEPEPADIHTNLAYVIFTSGSTGQPKGVLVEHRGILNFIDAQIDEFRLSPNSKALFYLSTNFDASISDIGTALLSGATLCIEAAENLQPGPAFIRMLKQRGITHMDVPPAILRILDPDQMPECLQTVIIGGEVCPPHIVRKWSSRFRVVNVYGPTEATVCTSLVACDPSTWQKPLIGRTVPGINYHLLNEELQPVAWGTPAELYIGGEGLARGYLNRGDLNAIKFIRRNGERLYRTGDRVIAHQPGEIEFLGRIDRQVKVRGLLIEPEEIEAKLKLHPDVQQAVVLKRPANEMSPREILVAFVVRKPGSKPDVRELRRHLSDSLPRWMLPSKFQFLPSMPCTPTGKPDLEQLRRCTLDHGRRPAPPLQVARSQAGESTQPVEATAVLKQIWQQVLGVAEINAEDDFFELGGDSFSIIEVLLSAEARGLSIPPDTLMSCSRFGDLLQKLQIEAAEPAHSSLPMTAEELLRHVNENKHFQALLSGGKNPSPERHASQGDIFITGATGFLGSKLMFELLQRTPMQIHCLIRSESQAAAWERLSQALQGHGYALTAADKQRVNVVCGSLESERFGLSQNEWRRLSESIATIYHCAAQVNMLLSFEALSPTNLQGTVQVARLMCEGRPKQLHYASTLSVFVATDQNTGRLMESDVLDQTRLVYGGYAQTKWASERLLRLLEGQSGSISHYRFGLITGDSGTGFSSPTDFLSLFIRGISALGYVPEEHEQLHVDVTPVDYSAAVMAHISLNSPECSTYHIANPISLPLKDLVQAMRDYGISLESLPAARFIQQAEASAAFSAETSAACLALCRCLPGKTEFDRLRSLDLFQATNVTFDTTNTTRALSGSSITCPRPDANLLKTYLRTALANNT